MSYGINYAGKLPVNVDVDNGIRYGVIPHNRVGSSWCDASEPEYAEPEQCDCVCPECNEYVESPLDVSWGDCIECPNCGEFELEFPDMLEPLGFTYDSDGYECEQIGEVDIFISKSPYYTHAKYCSPCAPGACYLLSRCDENGPKAYCFGPDWFDSYNPCPYPVYRVSDGALVYSPEPINPNDVW
jgi:hypothetical protein